MQATDIAPNSKPRSVHRKARLPHVTVIVAFWLAAVSPVHAQSTFQVNGTSFSSTACASEWRTCNLQGDAKVAFGANGVFAVRPASQRIACNSFVFGNPTAGPKKCYVEVASTAPVTQACFYEQENFTGASFCADLGQNNAPAGWDNKVSSVRVPAGWQLDLMEFAGFAGRRLTLTGDTPSLAPLGFNDVMSSYRVSVPSAAGGPVSRPVSKLCDGTTGAATETPLSAVGVERSVSLPTDRQRVAVNCINDAKNPGGPRLNVLRTDQGTPLRAGTSWVWRPNDGAGLLGSPAYFEQMRKAGLNAVRLIAFDVWEAEAYGGQFLQNFDDPVFLTKLRGLLETAVNNCSRYGMYCIINAHNKIGSFNPEVTRKFWQVMAPYFANRTHVVYEHVNEPLIGTGIGANYVFEFPQTLAVLRAGYNQIRTAAPHTHVMVLTPSGVSGWGYVDAMARLVTLFEQQPGAAIDWTNTSVAYHLYSTDVQFGSPNAENLRNLHARVAGWPSENNFPYGVSSEQLGITDPWRSPSFANEFYVNQTSEVLGFGWSMWNIEGPQLFSRNFPLIWNDAKTKGYDWLSDRRVPGELTRP